MSALVEFLLDAIAADEEQAADRNHLPLHRGVDRVTGMTLADRLHAESTAKRRLINLETTRWASLGEWRPDCGGDWCLSDGAGEDDKGVGYFANYWPDNTVSASVYVDGERVMQSGIVTRASKAQCMAFAEQWLAEHLPEVSPTLRTLASIYAERPGFQPEWRP